MIQVKVQVLMVSQLIMSHKHSTVTVEAECLNLLHRWVVMEMIYVVIVTVYRMYNDHEDVFTLLDQTMWYPSLVTLLTSDHQQVQWYETC